MVLCHVVRERCADLGYGLNRHNADVGVNCATQNRVYAAVCTNVNITAGAPNVVKDDWRGLLLPLPQTRPEYNVANSVELGGKPSALPPRSEYCKRLKRPTPGQEPSNPGRQKPTLACPGNRSTEGVQEER